MKKMVTTIFALSLAILACQTSGTPTPLNVQTVVAQTMQALTPGVSSLGMTPDMSPSGITDLLPHSLYFLNTDDAGFLQVHRLEANGITTRQVTFEPTNVETFDVSPVDGSVAYTSNNQLLLVGADGSNRRLLVDGGPLGSDESYFTNRVGGVAWSPNGQTIAFGFGGLNFYALSSGTINKVLENRVDNTAGFPILRESYRPEQYSPDGSKLLISIGYYEGGVYALYYISGNILIRSTDNPVTCCLGSWTNDSSAYFAASPYLGVISPGLWRINADGSVAVLLNPDISTSDPLDFAQSPLLGPDGQLYYFYNTMPSVEDAIDRMSLYMVRSAPDGVTRRTNLIPTPFEDINEVLWAPDASFAILVIAPVADVYQGGNAQLVYTDGRPVAPLLPFARNMRWGP